MDVLGSSISHYRVLEKLGQGGMGVVYKAEDTKLDRPVALKFLPAHLLGDEDVRKRFEREAKAAAALDHANVCTVHEIDEAGGKTFIAMALVEGESLDQRIARGPLKLDEALDIAQQVAKGLEAAHKRGIVHRDIKPENIMVGEDGHVTIMDFGLARLNEASRLTKTDETLGTVAYMSPEQTEGSEVDHRTDIWSLGVLLYEMITGQQPFKGDYDKAVMYSILNEEAEPITALRTAVPVGLEVCVSKCLAKQASQRYQGAAELLIDLSSCAEKIGQGKQAPPAGAQGNATRPSWRPSTREGVAWTFAGALALVALVTLFRTDERPPVERTPIRFAFSPPGLIRDLWVEDSAIDKSISPNGKYIAYVANVETPSIWIRDLNKESPTQLAYTDGATSFFWSPDSQFVAFAAEGQLKRVSIDGGLSSIVCELPSMTYFSGSWSPDGESIVFAAGPGGPPRLYEVPAAGGEPKRLGEPITTPKGYANSNPQHLPTSGGKRALLLDVGSPNDHDLAVLDLDTLQFQILLQGVQPFYSPTGHILYRTGISLDGLWALPFSIETLKPTGEPFPISEEGESPSVSRDGALVYSDYIGIGGRKQLAWFDRDGNKIGEIGQPQDDMWALSLAPGGSQVATSSSEAGDFELWLHSLDRNQKTRLTFRAGLDSDPVWSPSGKQIAYRVEGPLVIDDIARSAQGDILVRHADGSGEPRLVADNEMIERPSDWSRDGRYLTYTLTDPETNNDLWFADLQNGEPKIELHRFLETAASETTARFSPDGQYVAYCSNQSGRTEVYVRTFPEGANQRQISTDGGCDPHWRADGRELFYVHSQREQGMGELMAVETSVEPSFQSGSPHSLFSKPGLRHPGAGINRRYDVSADGQRFVMIENVEGDEPEQISIHVVQDWYEQFRDRE